MVYSAQSLQVEHCLGFAKTVIIMIIIIIIIIIIITDVKHNDFRVSSVRGGIYLTAFKIGNLLNTCIVITQNNHLLFLPI